MRSIEWKNGIVRFLDQSLLPSKVIFVDTNDENVIAQAIKTLAIRGAPLIGIAAAYGFVLAFDRVKSSDSRSLSVCLEKTSHLFASTRPTAVNLFWAINRMRRVVERCSKEAPGQIKADLLREARTIHKEDAERCRVIGELGADLLPNAARVLTHCNTGSLATGGDGTAQSVLKVAWERHKLNHVYIDETRPLLQGARLTAWELQQLHIPSTLITDNTAAFLFQQGKINAVVVGADRITLKGDVANKVGTYGLAVQAKFHRVPFYVAAPTSTIDFEMRDGKDIPIEQRDGREVTHIRGLQIAPKDVAVYSPAFDVTPHDLIYGIITERGVLQPPFLAKIRELKS